MMEKCLMQNNFLVQAKAKSHSTFLDIYSKRSFCCDKIQSYNDAIILSVRHGNLRNHDFGGVLTNTGSLVEDSLIPGWITGWYDDYDQLIKSNSAVVYCGRMIGHWGHFLLETITRLWFYIRYDSPELIYVFTVSEGSNPEINGNFKLFFDLLGLGKRVIFLNHATRFNNVIVPERSFQFKKFYSREYIDIFDVVINNALSRHKRLSHADKVYLSRSNFARAIDSEIGLDFMDNFMEKNGYNIIFPEQIPLDELISILNGASKCASESGTAAHNFLFCNKSQMTYVFERQLPVNEAQLSIDVARNLGSVYIDASLTLSAEKEPCFLYYTDCMKKFVTSNQLNPPDDIYLSRSQKIMYLEMYKALYYNIHKKQISIEDEFGLKKALELYDL